LERRQKRFFRTKKPFFDFFFVVVVVTIIGQCHYLADVLDFLKEYKADLQKNTV
jgi:hypothetical protein